MVKNISKEEIARLRQPCKNRNIELIDNEDGTITINNSKFGLNSDAENYLIDLPRTDIPMRKAAPQQENRTCQKLQRNQ